MVEVVAVDSFPALEGRHQQALARQRVAPWERQVAVRLDVVFYPCQPFLSPLESSNQQHLVVTCSAPNRGSVSLTWGRLYLVVNR